MGGWGSGRPWGFDAREVTSANTAIWMSGNCIRWARYVMKNCESVSMKPKNWVFKIS